jgi:hypothetical protein
MKVLKAPKDLKWRDLGEVVSIGAARTQILCLRLTRSFDTFFIKFVALYPVKKEEDIE